MRAAPPVLAPARAGLARRIRRLSSKPYLQRTALRNRLKFRTPRTETKGGSLYSRLLYLSFWSIDFQPTTDPEFEQRTENILPFVCRRTNGVLLGQFDSIGVKAVTLTPEPRATPCRIMRGSTSSPHGPRAILDSLLSIKEGWEWPLPMYRCMEPPGNKSSNASSTT